LAIVKPATVIAWHRAGFRLYWRWRSRPRGGRPRVSEEIRELIRQMNSENSDWGAPKIHGELLKLGFEVSERTVARYPTSEWVVQQLREAFSEADPYRYVIFDQDSKFNADVITLLQSTGLSRSERAFTHPGKTA
jgi:hypothetical protein